MQTEMNVATRIDILRIVAEARRARDNALGELIAVHAGRFFSTLADKADAFLHSMLMSPVNRRLVK